MRSGTLDERSIEQAEVAGLSQGQIVRRRFVRHRGAMVALTLLFLIIVLAATSIGWGPIPGWWKWTLHRPRAVELRLPANRRCRCARHGSAVPASASATTRSDSTTRPARTCSR